MNLPEYEKFSALESRLKATMPPFPALLHRRGNPSRPPRCRDHERLVEALARFRIPRRTGFGDIETLSARKIGKFAADASVAKLVSDDTISINRRSLPLGGFLPNRVAFTTDRISDAIATVLKPLFALRIPDGVDGGNRQESRRQQAARDWARNVDGPIGVSSAAIAAIAPCSRGVRETDIRRVSKRMSRPVQDDAARYQPDHVENGSRGKLT